MSTTDLNLALRIKADLEQARQQIAAVGDDLQGLGRDANDANAGLDGLSGKLDSAGSQSQKTTAQLGAAGSAAGKTGSAAAAAAAKVGIYTDAAGRLREANGQFVTSARKAELGLDDLGDAAEDAGKKTATVGSGAVAAESGLSKLLPKLITAGSAMAALTKAVAVQRQFDTLNAGLITATGSTEKAAEAFDILQAFAATTPYSLDQSVAGFTKLVNLGLTPSEDALRSYGNTSAALGKDLEQMIEAVADAATGEFERLKEFGIKASAEGDKVRFTFQGTTTEVGNSAAEIEQYLIGIGNVNFAGAMEQRMNSLDGAISNLGDSWDQLFLNVNQAGLGELMRESVMLAVGALDELNAMVASGELEGYLDAIGMKFDGFAQDAAESIEFLTRFYSENFEQLHGDGEEAVDFLIEAFARFPENVRAFIQTMVVEVASGLDKASSYAAAFRDGIKAVFTDDTLEGVGARLEQELAGINDARGASIGAILAEREAASAAAAERTEQARQARADYEAERKAASEATGDRLAQFKLATSATNESTEANKKAVDAAQKLLDQQTTYVQGLERQAAQQGMTSAEVRRHELAERNLTGALAERANAALAALEATERQQQAEANAARNVQLQADLLRAGGNGQGADLLELQTRFDQMRAEFAEAGNAAGLQLLDQLLPVEQAAIRVSAIKQQIDDLLAEQQRQEQSVNVQQDAGLLTELDARRQILDIHKQTAAELEKMRPLLAEMARQPGAVGQSARAALQGLDNQAVRLRATTSLLAETLRTGIEQGLARALQGLADGTMTVRDAVRSLAQSVLQSMAQLAAQQLAQQATQGFAGMFSGITQAAPQAVQAITTVQTAQQAATTAMTASSAAAATTTAATQAGAAATTAASWTPAAIAASIGSFGGAAAIGLAAVMAALAFQAFADGGHVTGPGTATSDSIPAWLSNGEFVSRAAVVAQPGALGFLHDFNARGMSALDDWAGAVRHSTGGLAGIPAPAMPGPGRVAGRLAEPAKAFSTTVQNRQTFNLIDSPERIASALNTPAGHEAITVMLSNDPAKFRSILGV
jgi:hypothetical protein